jgi:hypothetical protein
MSEPSEQSARLDNLSAICVCYGEHCAPAAARHKKSSIQLWLYMSKKLSD